MLPVLFTIANIAISSFGFFLALGFLFSAFLVWRLSRAWDLDEERVLDLVLVTFVIGLISARLYFVSENFAFFAQDIIRVFQVTKYSGLSFWGGFLGGWLALYYFGSKTKIPFLTIADIATIGFFAGIIFADWGCLLGGCGNGVSSNLFLSVHIQGLIGKRFPVQALEALILAIILLKLWLKAIRFHPPGKILSLGLLYLGTVKFFTEFLRDQKGGIISSSGYFFSLILIILGLIISFNIYKSSIRLHKTTFGQDIVLFVNYLVKQVATKETLQTLVKDWYNKTSVYEKYRNFIRLLRKIHVKPTPK